MKYSNKEIKKIMNETCWGSLAFCCSLDKPCQSRDGVLKKLGLTKKDFIRLKKQFDENLFNLKNPLPLSKKGLGRSYGY